MSEIYSEFVSDKIYIGGPVEGSSERSTTTVNPFNGEEIVTIKNASKEDVDRAYEVAHEAQKEWMKLTPAERGAILSKAADYVEENIEAITQLLRTESGSSLIKSQIEVGGVVDQLRQAATFPTRIKGSILPSNAPQTTNYIFREPLGVVGVISPWNFPFLLSMRSVAPAVGAGNGVVIKPASDTPLIGGTVIAKIFEEAGAPKGLVNVVVGSGSEIGDYFVEHEGPQLISFTGSTPVGKSVGAKAVGGEHLKRIALELGGNSPLIVLEDADFDAAVEAGVMGKFLHQGQICMATNRIIVEESIYDKYVDAYVEKVKSLPYGDPLNDDTIVGPIINEQQLKSVTSKIEQARDEGAREVLAGSVEGQMVSPHVFADVTPDMEIFQEEIFGPVIGITKAKDADDALRLANATKYGLSSAVFTQDMQKAIDFSRGIVAGMTHVNDITVADEAHVMFGGEKNSGIGRFNSDWVLEEFTREHWVSYRG